VAVQVLEMVHTGRYAHASALSLAAYSQGLPPTSPLRAYRTLPAARVHPTSSW